MPSSGYAGPEPHGATCLPILGNGDRSIADSFASPNAAHSSGCTGGSPSLTPPSSSWTRPSARPRPARRELAKKAIQRDFAATPEAGQRLRRILDQDPRRDRAGSGSQGPADHSKQAEPQESKAMGSARADALSAKEPDREIVREAESVAESLPASGQKGLLVRIVHLAGVSHGLALKAKGKAGFPRNSMA